MTPARLDLRATQKLAEAVSPGYGDYSRLAQETLALLTHCRELRAALQEVEFGGQKAGWTGPVSCCAACYGPRYRNFLGAQSEDVPTYEDAGHKPACAVGAVLASCTDGEAAP